MTKQMGRKTCRETWFERRPFQNETMKRAGYDPNRQAPNTDEEVNDRRRGRALEMRADPIAPFFFCFFLFFFD